jgi:hypothetical protein
MNIGNRFGYMDHPLVSTLPFTPSRVDETHTMGTYKFKNPNSKRNMRGTYLTINRNV